MLIDRRRRHVRPHPARRQFRRRGAPVPVVMWATRLAWEQDALRSGLGRAAAFWRWLAARRGERAVREGAR
jgi:hypothetical protein